MDERPLGIHDRIATRAPSRATHESLACKNCGSNMPRERTQVQVHGRAAAFVGTLAIGAGLGGVLYTAWTSAPLAGAFAPACLLVLGFLASARVPHMRCLQCGALSRVD